MKISKSIASIVFLLGLLLQSQKALCGGPVIITGLDTEYGIRTPPLGTMGDVSHGTIPMWKDVIYNGILANVTSNPSGGILVIGGGKTSTDEMTSFWTQIAGQLGRPVTFKNGTAAITSASFSGYAMIAVCNTAYGSGKLTSAELSAISARQSDISNFVNSGGGLFASACDLSPVYGYIYPGSPPLTSVPSGTMNSNSTPTAFGTQMGISTIIGPYHNTFSQWPSFLSVLSTLSGNKACILGGKNVTIPGSTPPITYDPCCPPWNKDLLASMMLYAGGTIGDPYTLHFQPTALFNTQMNAYLNYLHSLNPAINAITMFWSLHDQGMLSSPTPAYGLQVGGSTATVPVTWTGGAPNVSGLFTGSPMLVGTWYCVHTAIFLNSGIKFYPPSCYNNDIFVRVQLLKSSNGPSLDISDGKQIIKTVPINQIKESVIIRN